MARVGTMLLIEADAGRLMGRLTLTPEVESLRSGEYPKAMLMTILTGTIVRPTQTFEIIATMRRLGSLPIDATVTVRRAHVSEGRRRWRARA